MQDKGAGFAGDTNKVTVIDNKGGMQQFELKSKKEVANDIVTLIAAHQAAINS